MPPPPEAAHPTSASDEAARIAAVVDPLIRADLESSGTPGAAFVFVRDGRIVYQRGYGLSDTSTRAAVDPERTVWPIASITKEITTIAVLQLVDQKRVDLDTDVNRYLKRLQVPSQGYEPLTLRHLFTHTAALDEFPGRQFDGKAPPDMAAFLQGRLVRYRAPGVLTAYSTYGIALAGVLLEDVTGQKYAEYVRRHVVEPAGMRHAWIMTKRGDEQGLATGYAVEDGKAEAVPYEWYVTTPTSSMVATAADMGRLALAQLAGSGAAPTASARKSPTTDAGAPRHHLLGAQLSRAMQTQQATNHPDIRGWGFGMQLDRVNGIEIAEHGGDIAGFASLFVLLPEEGAGLFIVHHGEGGDLRFRVKQALIDALYPAKNAPQVPQPDPKNAVSLAEYGGRYISSIACRTCPGSEEDAFEAAVEPNGTLSLWGQTWVPLRRDLFIRDDGKRMLGFARDAQGSIVSVTGGSWRVADRLRAPKD